MVEVPEERAPEAMHILRQEYGAVIYGMYGEMEAR